MSLVQTVEVHIPPAIIMRHIAGHLKHSPSAFSFIFPTSPTLSDLDPDFADTTLPRISCESTGNEFSALGALTGNEALMAWVKRGVLVLRTRL